MPAEGRSPVMASVCSATFLVRMKASKAAVARWARGHELAARRIAWEAGRQRIPFAVALARVDELRRVADGFGAKVARARAERENLAFHLSWSRLRQAYGVG